MRQVQVLPGEREERTGIVAWLSVLRMQSVIDAGGNLHVSRVSSQQGSSAASDEDWLDRNWTLA